MFYLLIRTNHEKVPKLIFWSPNNAKICDTSYRNQMNQQQNQAWNPQCESFWSPGHKRTNNEGENYAKRVFYVRIMTNHDNIQKLIFLSPTKAKIALVLFKETCGFLHICVKERPPPTPSMPGLGLVDSWDSCPKKYTKTSKKNCVSLV